MLKTKQKKEGVGEATGEGEQVQASREATPAEPDAGEGELLCCCFSRG